MCSQADCRSNRRSGAALQWFRHGRRRRARVWFPKMIERLRSQWQPGISSDALVDLRDDLDAMLQRIRSERHIRPPVLRCPRCGHVGEGAEPHVSVRAMILSLLRFGIGDAEHVKDLEKSWAAIQAAEQARSLWQKRGTGGRQEGALRTSRSPIRRRHLQRRIAGPWRVSED